MGRIAEVATGARIHGCYKHKIGREGYLGIGAGDGDLLIF